MRAGDEYPAAYEIAVALFSEQLETSKNLGVRGMI